MFCKSCGSSIEEGVKFCTKCGMPVESAFQSTDRPNVESAAQPTMANNRNKRGMKKAIVLLAIFSLCALFISKITAEISGYNYRLEFDMIPEGFLRYLFVENVLNTVLAVFLPLLSGCLFILFCKIIDKKSPALTGVPYIISLITQVVILIYNHTVLHGSVDLFSIFALLLSGVFIIFYMMAVTGKFKSGTTGKVLTIVFACVLGLLCSLGVITYIGVHGTTIGITIPAGITLLFEFIANVVMYVAMVMCVFYTSKPDTFNPDVNQ